MEYNISCNLKVVFKGKLFLVKLFKIYRIYLLGKIKWILKIISFYELKLIC